MYYRGAATGFQASNLGLVLRGCQPWIIDDSSSRHSRRVSLVCATSEGQNGPVFWQFPGAHAGLQDFINGGGLVDHVGDPSVPFNIA